MTDLFGFEPPKAPPLNNVDGIPGAVLELFERLANHLVETGWNHYSADAILHRVRWHFQVEKGDREFKCNNNWTSHLARWWMDRHPEHSEFFETRALASERENNWS
jgi:hypothetical protein